MEFIKGITPTANEKKVIEEKTRLQASSARWHEERHCRLTASTVTLSFLFSLSFSRDMA